MPGGIPQPQPNWTLLRMIQEFCRRQNLQVPQGVVASTDEEVTQLWGLLNESVMSLSTRGDWPHLNRRFEFLHQRAENSHLGGQCPSTASVVRRAGADQVPDSGDVVGEGDGDTRRGAAE